MFGFQTARKQIQIGPGLTPAHAEWTARFAASRQREPESSHNSVPSSKQGGFRATAGTTKTNWIKLPRPRRKTLLAQAPARTPTKPSW